MDLKFHNNIDPSKNESVKRETALDEIGYSLLEYNDIYSENGIKKFKIKNLGEKFATINSHFLEYLKAYHIPAGFLKLQGKKSLRFVKHKRLPFSVKLINLINKRTARLFHKKENEILSLPITEFHFGTAKETLITESHLLAFDFCTIEELRIINRVCSKVNAVLKSFFERRNELLAEVTCWFGKAGNKLYVVDDFTPKSLRVIPANNQGKWVNPYKLATSNDVKKYTDHIIKLMSN